MSTELLRVRRRRMWAVAVALLLVACGILPASPTGEEARGEPAARTSEDRPRTDWEGEWAQSVAAAKREKLVVVTHPGVNEQEFVRAFQRAFPDVKVEHMGMRPSDFAPRVITEQRNGQFLWDVMVARTANMVDVLTPAGVFQDIRPFFLLPDSIDDRNWHGGFALYAQNVTHQPLTLVHVLHRPRGLWVNRDRLPATQFSGIDDLLRPELRGQIVIDEPSVPTQGSQTLAIFLKLRGEEFVRKLLVDQRPTFVDDVALGTTWLAEGRYAVAVGVDLNRLDQLKAAGVGRNVTEVKIAATGALFAAGASVFRNAPHPAATRVFLNWLWSNEGQTVYSQSAQLNSRRKDVAPFEADAFPDYDHLEQYTLQGTQQGSELILQVIALYRSVR